MKNDTNKKKRHRIILESDHAKISKEQVKALNLAHLVRITDIQLVIGGNNQNTGAFVEFEMYFSALLAAPIFLDLQLKYVSYFI